MPQPPFASTDDSKKLLPRWQPQIQQQLHAELKKAGSSLKQRSQQPMPIVSQAVNCSPSGSTKIFQPMEKPN